MLAGSSEQSWRYIVQELPAEDSTEIKELARLPLAGGGGKPLGSSPHFVTLVKAVDNMHRAQQGRDMHSIFRSIIQTSPAEVSEVLLEDDYSVKFLLTGNEVHLSLAAGITAANIREEVAQYRSAARRAEDAASQRVCASQVRLYANGAEVDYLEPLPEHVDGPVEAFVSDTTWRGIMGTWTVQRIKDFVTGLSGRPMPDSADGSWGSCGAFGVMVESVDKVMHGLLAPTRGGDDCGDDLKVLVEEIVTVLDRAASVSGATPASVLQAFEEELGLSTAT